MQETYQYYLTIVFREKISNNKNLYLKVFADVTHDVRKRTIRLTFIASFSLFEQPFNFKNVYISKELQKKEKEKRKKF